VVGKPAAAAQNFRLDLKGAEVRRALAEAGVRTVLLKGAAFSQLLYSSPGQRAYSDIDLLLDERQLDTAHVILAGMDFARFDEDSPAAQTDPSVGDAIGVLGAVHGGAWLRARDGVVVDLHTTLPQVPAEPSRVWAELSPRTQAIDVGGLEAEALDPPASALVVALHAAHHGGEWGPSLMDLGRAVAVLDDSTWREAAALARTLGAEQWFGVGLGLDPRGRQIAESLGLSIEPSAGLRALWAGGTWSSIVLAAIREEGSVTARARLILRVVWPSPAAMRRGSSLARRGPLGLAAAYVLRPVQLGARLWRNRGAVPRD
jgi:hypothetical protein